jgi:hypothetical protein
MNFKKLNRFFACKTLGPVLLACISLQARAATMELSAPEIAAMVPLFARADVPVTSVLGSCSLSQARILVDSSFDSGEISFKNEHIKLDFVELQRVQSLAERAASEADSASAVTDFLVSRDQCGLGHTYWSIAY